MNSIWDYLGQYCEFPFVKYMIEEINNDLNGFDCESVNTESQDLYTITDAYDYNKTSPNESAVYKSLELLLKQTQIENNG